MEAKVQRIMRTAGSGQRVIEGGWGVEVGRARA